MVINIKDSTKMVNLTVKANTHGLTDQYTRGSLSMALVKGKVVGNHPKTMVTSISDLMKPIRKTDMDGMFGLMDASTKVTLPTMLSNHLFISGMERED